jgi:6-phosphogluconolactonase (cycloisomerase 2 family)
MPAVKRLPSPGPVILAGVLSLLLAACGGSTSGPTGPTISAQPADQSVVMGASASFSVTATGSGTLSYQWSRNGTAIPGATAATYATAATVLADSGATFSCTVSNGTLPDATSAPATLTVNPPPGTFDVSASTISHGEGVILTYDFPGTATLQEGTGAPVPVTSGETTVVYPSATTAYTFTWTRDGATDVVVRTVTVKTYRPRNLYVVNGGSNTIARFTVDLAGTGNPISQKVASLPTGKDPIHVVASPDEKFLYVANASSASVSAYAVNATTGALTAVPGSPFALPSDSSPFASAVHPSGKFLYVACQGSIQVLAIAPAGGALTPAPTLKAAIPGRVAGDVVLHPSGKFLFVADAGHGVVKSYAVDAGTGALAFVADAPSAGAPTGIALDRAGTLLFTRGTAVNAANNASLNTFAIDPYTGVLTLASRFEGFDAVTTNLPFVRGTDNGHHGLAFSRQPGLDVLYDAYASEVVWPSCMSAYQIDLAGRGVAATGWDVGRGPVPYDPATTFGGPIFVDFWGSSGDSVVLDRSGTALVLTSSFGIGRINFYPVTADGSLLGSFIGDYGADSGAPGDLPAHAAFTGTFQ